MEKKVRLNRLIANHFAINKYEEDAKPKIIGFLFMKKRLYEGDVIPPFAKLKEGEKGRTFQDFLDWYNNRFLMEEKYRDIKKVKPIPEEENKRLYRRIVDIYAIKVDD